LQVDTTQSADFILEQLKEQHQFIVSRSRTINIHPATPGHVGSSPLLAILLRLLMMA
jgi:hypothetical protein